MEKLPSGAYRVRKTFKGKRYSLTFDKKPSKSDIERKFRELIEKNETDIRNLTFKQAAEQYCDMKENVLSPKTIKEYLGYLNNMPEWFKNIKIDNITQVEINKLVNDMMAPKYRINKKTKKPDKEKKYTLSSKTISNRYSLVSTVLGTFRPELKLYTTLPQKVKNKPYIPSDDDVSRILKEFEGTRYYIPLILACYGLRRSEIIAIKPSDIESNVIHITKATVQNKKNEWVEKINKTTESERDILVSQEIADMIIKQGYVYKGSAECINQNLKRVEKKLGIPDFTLHKLRHYFASKMITITDIKTIQELGGWKTDSVLKNVYAHAMESEKEKAKKEAVNILNNSLFS